MTRFVTRSALLLACATAAPLAVTRAQQPIGGAPGSQVMAKHPNMAGMWELDVAKSNFAQGAPTKGTMVLTQAGDTITTTATASMPTGDVKNTMHHMVGGAATTDTIGGGGQQMPFTSTSRWDGTTLVVDGKASSQGMEIPVVSRYTLSPDGKTLTIDQVITTPGGEMTQRIVYNKKS